MAIQMNIGEAKTRLSELVAATERGEEVILARAGRPVVKLQPVEMPLRTSRREKRFAALGMCQGSVTPEIIEAGLAPLDEADLALWYNAPILSAGTDAAP
jgi:prevent-host-death family protein